MSSVTMAAKRVLVTSEMSFPQFFIIPCSMRTSYGFEAFTAIFFIVSSVLSVIYIDTKLTETQQKTVLIHELGHLAKQRDEKELYDVTISMKMKMEYGANKFMIKYLFSNYIDVTGDDPHSVNYLEFMRQNDIPSRDENIVKEVILNY